MSLRGEGDSLLDSPTRRTTRIALSANADGAKCLIVEDNNVLQRVMGQWLSRTTLGCTHVMDGLMAVTACQREKFDIIFMDICMPNMNGIDATRTIRTDPSSANQTTPIIAFAGNAETAAMVSAGFNDVLQKPFTQEHLVAKVNQWARQDKEMSALMSGQSVDAAAEVELGLFDPAVEQSIDLFADIPNFLETLQQVMGGTVQHSAELQQHHLQPLSQNNLPLEAHQHPGDGALSDSLMGYEYAANGSGIDTGTAVAAAEAAATAAAYGTPYEDRGGNVAMQHQRAPPPSQTHTTSVLVVEDDNVTQRVVTQYLKKMGANVTQAYDGAQAVEACTQTLFDVIFMDMSMPNVNGLEATRVIRSPDGLNRFTPMIAFSSYGNANEFSRLGMNDYLAKPFTKTDLCGIVEKWTPFHSRSTSSSPSSGPANGSPVNANNSGTASTAAVGTAGTPATSASTTVPSLTAPVGVAAGSASASNSTTSMSSATANTKMSHGTAPIAATTSTSSLTLPATVPSNAVAASQSTASLTLMSSSSDTSAASPSLDTSLDNLTSKTSRRPAAPYQLQQQQPPSQSAQSSQQQPQQQQQRRSFSPRSASPPFYSPHQGTLSVASSHFQQSPSSTSAAPFMALRLSQSATSIGESYSALSPQDATGSARSSRGSFAGTSRSSLASPPPLNILPGQSQSEGTVTSPPLSPLSVRHSGGPAKKMRHVTAGPPAAVDEDVTPSGYPRPSRVQHNDKERVRRREISEAVDEFRRLVPGCSDRTDKATVLKAAVEYMRSLMTAMNDTI